MPLSWTFDQREQLASDQDGVFGNGLRTRNEFRNHHYHHRPTLSASVFTGLRYELPLNSSKTMIAMPELRFMYGLSNVSKAP